MRTRFLQFRNVIKAITLILMIGVVGITKGFAYSFSAVCETGQTLYYSIADATNHYVGVVYPGSDSSNPWNGYTKPTGNLIIPNTVEYNSVEYQVTNIDASAFSGCSGLTLLTIKNSVTSMGNSAFSGCSELTTVYWDAVNVMGYPNISNNPFSNCTNLSTVVFGDSVETIPDYAFSGCSSLTSLTIGNSAMSIGALAFYGCSSLTSLTIGNSVTSIGGYAFYGCSGLTTVYWDAVNVMGYPYTSSNPFINCTNLSTVVFGDSVETIPDTAFSGCSSLTSLTIGNSVTSIGGYAFYGCSGLTSLTIGNSVTSIGSGAFDGCSGLTSLTIGNSVTSIGSETFNGCSGLTSLTIGNSVTSIGYKAFNGCSGLTSLTIPNSLTSIGYDAFSGCSELTTVYWNAINVTNCFILFSNCTSLSTVVFGDSVETIPDYAFYGCSGLSGSLTIPNSVTSIGYDAFYGCSGLTSLTIGNSVTSIGSEAFDGCSGLTSLTIGNSVTSIGNYAFNECTGLTSLTIGNSVTSIGRSAFSRCNGLTSLTIPNSVTSIGRAAFYECSGITGSLMIPNSVTNIGSYAFYGCSGLTGSLTIPNSVTSIRQETFKGCSGLTSLTIPNSVTSIGESAFYGCSGLTGSLTIPNSVTSIGNSAFYGCSGLTLLTIGEGVKSIGEYAFWECPELTTVRYKATNCNTMQTNYNGNLYSVFSTDNEGTNLAITSLIISNNVTRIPNYAFTNAQSIQRIILPDSITEVGNYAFSDCVGLVLLRVQGTAITTIGDYAFDNCFNMVYTMNLPNLNYIGEYAFCNCSAMTGSITIPSAMTSIEPYTFYNCSGLNGTLTMPDNITVIGAYAFYNCSGLTGNLIIPDNVSTIGAGAFYNCSGLTGEIYIPRQTTSIGANTFYNCSGLSGNLLIPKSIETIEDGVFYNCSGLTSIISECNNYPAAQNTTFEGVTTSIPVYVPYGQTQNYQAATGWNVFNNYIDQFQFEQYDTDEWSDDYNWYTFEQPSSNDVVCLHSDCQLNVDASVLYIYIPNPDHTLTIKSGQTLTTQYGIGLDNTSQLVIEDGGQIVYGNGTSYNISAVINLAGAGSVTGGDVYSPFSTCTLTASSNIGYTFINWAKDDVVVSTDSTYSFIVSEPGEYVANFSQNKYAITAMTNFEEGGYVVINRRGGSDAITCDFENGLPEDWSTIDADGDGYNWTNSSGGHNSYGLVTSASFVNSMGALTPDNYLISPQLMLGGSITFYACAQDANYASEHIGVAVSTISNTNADDFVTINEWTITDRGKGAPTPITRDGNTRTQSLWKEYTVDLSAYNGQLGYVAIRHFNCTDMYYVNVDDITITQGPISTVGGLFTYGQSCTINAIPFEGYTFINWTKDGEVVSTNSEYSFVVTEDATYIANFGQPAVTQTINLVAGTNWFSANVEITFNDLKAALVAASPNAAITIKSQTQKATYNPSNGRWTGRLTTFDLSQMYKITVSSACVITLQGVRINPAEHPVTITPGANWIAYPLNTNKTPQEIFTGFAVAGDMVKSQSQKKQYNSNGRWTGQLGDLEPGKGYIYTSSATEDRTFVFPIFQKSYNINK